MEDDITPASGILAPMLGAWMALVLIAGTFFGLPYLRDAIRSAAETRCPDVCTKETD
jgi:hypothetical protein